MKPGDQKSEQFGYEKGTPQWRISVIMNIFAEYPGFDSIVLNNEGNDEVSIKDYGDARGYYVYILRNKSSDIFFKRIRIEINPEGEITEVEDTPGKKISGAKKKRYSAMFDDELEKFTTHLASGLGMETRESNEPTAEESRESSAGIIKKIRKKLKL